MKKPNLERIIMGKVKTNEIKMKPSWYFLVGSTLMVIGLISFTIAAIFALSLMLFLLKEHGPMGQWRLQVMIDSFPLWVPLLAVLGIGIGVYLLKQYEFSYKKNFLLIALGFISSIILAALVLDYMGLSTVWFRQGPMRKMYQKSSLIDSTNRRREGKQLRQKQFMYSPR